jgi:hypothetical protein
LHRSPKALGITGTLTTSTTGVTITAGTGLQFGDINPGLSACGVIGTLGAGSCASGSTYYPTVSLATSVATGTTITFTLAVSDQNGNKFTVSFSYAVTAINQAFAAGTLVVYGDTNGDGKLSPGESAQLKVSIQNTGTSKALGITGTLTTSTTGVTITGGTGLQFGDINPGLSACGVIGTLGAGSCASGSTYYPTVSLATSAATGTTITFTLALKDQFGNVFAVSFSVTVY